MTKVHLPYTTSQEWLHCDVREPTVALSYSYSSTETGTWWFAKQHLHNCISNILRHWSHEIQDSWKLTAAAIVADMNNILPCLTYKKANITIQVTGKVQEFIRIPKSRILLQIWRRVIQFPLKSVVNLAMASITFAQEIILTSSIKNAYNCSYNTKHVVLQLQFANTKTSLCKIELFGGHTPN